MERNVITIKIDATSFACLFYLKPVRKLYRANKNERWYCVGKVNHFQVLMDEAFDEVHLV